MNLLQAILLGILQGATEFIPVSSSGHLELVPWLLGWEPAGLAFTVVLHLGTVVGVLLFFWQDWMAMLRGALRWAQSREANPDARLLGLILLGTIPAALLGLLFDDAIESLFSRPLSAALMLFVTAALLVIGERLGRQTRQAADMSLLDGLLVGAAQALAIMPGISRSGATISAARLRDVERAEAARFSFLLSTPIIVGAGLIQVIELAASGLTLSDAVPLLAGFAAAFISAYFVIRWLLNFLRTRPVTVFAVYCVLMGSLSVLVYVLRAG